MAPKKINPAQLAQLAAIKTKVKPQAEGDSGTDWEAELFGTTTTTTTAPPAPVVPTTTVPTGQIPVPKGQKSTDPLSTTLNNKIASLESQLFATKTPAQIAKVKTGATKSQPWWKKAVGLAINNPVTELSVLQPLKTLAFVGRIGVSAFEESAQFAREKVRGKDVYEATDYIPTHDQTGVPIAKPGDAIVRNWEEIVKTPISDEAVKAANLATTTAAQKEILKAATMDIVNSKKRTSSGSISEFARQVGSPMEFKDYGFWDISEVQIGRQLQEAGKISPSVAKWIDRGVGLVGDIGLDPTTYLTLGTTTAAKTGAKALGGLTDSVIADVAESLVKVGVKQATKDAAVIIARETGEEVTSKITQQTARAVVAEAAKVAEQRVIINATGAVAEKEAAKIVQQAARRWSAIAPRREIGAGARQATANEVSQLRDEALNIIDELAPIYGENPTVLAARNFVSVITDDVIRDIAVRGNSAITGKVGRALSIPGGLRFGPGKFKVSIPGSQYVTAPISKGFTLPRQALAATEAGRKVIGATTRVGNGGLFGSEYIYNWRTGLRSGYNASTGAKLTGKEAVEALKRLAEDQTYRALKKTTSQTIKVAVDSIFRQKEFKPYMRSVHEILTNPLYDDNFWKQTAEEISSLIGRPLDEIKLALRIRDIRDEFSKILSDLSDTLGGGTVDFPENWFPEALNDKTVLWLSKDSPIVRDTLTALGLNTAPLAGSSIGEPLEAGLKFFGRRLTDDDIAGGITRFNQIAREGGFKGEFFDTHAGSAIEKWAKKFADDYAFLRNVNRGDLEKLSGGAFFTDGARTFPPTVFSSGMVMDLLSTDMSKLALDIMDGKFDDVADYEVLNLSEKLGLTPEKTWVIANELKDEIDNGLLDWVFNDDGSVIPEFFAQRFDFKVAAQQLDELVEKGLLPEIRATVAGKQAENLRIPKTPRNEKALAEADDALRTIADILEDIDDEMILGGKDGAGFLNGMSGVVSDEMQMLLPFFAQNPEKLANIIENVNPRMLDTMINMTEDAFIKLDNQIIPNLYAKKELATIYANVRRLKEPKFQNGAIRFIRNYNRFIKTWVTNTPGFHQRNLLGNVWQMIAGGGQLKNMEEGRKIISAWNGYVKLKTGTIKDIESITKKIINLGSAATEDTPEVIALAKQLQTSPRDILTYKVRADDAIDRLNAPPSDWRFIADYMELRTRLDDPELLMDMFLVEGPGAAFSPAQQIAFQESMMFTGAAGFGDVEEVFGAAIPSRLGITGSEVPVRTGPIGSRASAVSEAVGAIPRASRSFGGKIENYSRFIFTYDGIRQGLTPEQAAARTARYLVDYEDLTKLDEVAKLIFPFWTWMSRNLPVQTANMFMNPKAYSIYQNFRENFEDKDGSNVLLPDYLKKAGAFKAPFGKNIYVKPDFGFPGAGSPSPLQEGVTDLRSLLSSMPLYSLGSAITGTQAYSGAPLEGAGEIIPEVIQQGLPPLGVAGRYISGIPGIGAGSDWGALGPVQDLLGVKGPRESGATSQQRRALASLLGIPLQNVGPDQENAARYEIIKRLQDELNAIKRGQG